MLPQPVTALLARAFPGAAVADVAPTFGGFSNLTLAATLGGRPVVIKAAEAPLKRADLRWEAGMLGLLAGAGLPIPELLALEEDAAWSVEVLAAIVGENGLRFYSGDLAELAPVYAALGRLLASVHRLPPAAPAPHFRLWEHTRPVLEQLPALGLEPALHTTLADALTHPAWQPQALRLVHGDAGLHNLLWRNGVAALLDWEWAGWGNPLLDLGWIYWTTRLRNAPADAWPAFLEGYAAYPELRALDATPAALRALVLGQIACILLRAQDRPEARQEWLRRARWTETLDFPDLAA
jgi:aminoglycoside phosphotransferase (APT) family kinase protein